MLCFPWPRWIIWYCRTWGIIEKLEISRIRGPFFGLLRSNASEKKQFVSPIRNFFSETRAMKRVFPQGSYWDQSSFIYVTDLSLVCKNSNTTLFAEDTSIYSSQNEWHQNIDEDIHMRNTLNMNHNKSKFLETNSKISRPQLKLRI